MLYYVIVIEVIYIVNCDVKQIIQLNSSNILLIFSNIIKKIKDPPLPPRSKLLSL